MLQNVNTANKCIQDSRVRNLQNTDGEANKLLLDAMVTSAFDRLFDPFVLSIVRKGGESDLFIDNQQDYANAAALLLEVSPRHMRPIVENFNRERRAKRVAISRDFSTMSIKDFALKYGLKSTRYITRQRLYHTTVVWRGRIYPVKRVACAKCQRVIFPWDAKRFSHKRQYCAACFKSLKEEQHG